MTRLSKLLARFRADTSGANAIEYSLLVGSIAVGIVIIVDQIGQDLLVHFYERIAAAVSS